MPHPLWGRVRKESWEGQPAACPSPSLLVVLQSQTVCSQGLPHALSSCHSRHALASPALLGARYFPIGLSRASWPLPVGLWLVGLEGRLSPFAFPEEIWNVHLTKLRPAQRGLDVTPEEERGEPGGKPEAPGQATEFPRK